MQIVFLHHRCAQMNRRWAEFVGRGIALVAIAATVVAIAIIVVAHSSSITGLRRYGTVLGTAEEIVTITVAATGLLGMLVMLVCIATDVDPPKRVTYSTVWAAWLFGIILWTFPVIAVP